MDHVEFTRRYPRRLLGVADKAKRVVCDGVPQQFGPTKGRVLRLTAYYQTIDTRGTKTEPVRVVMDRVQTEHSLSRILLAVFTLEEARLVRQAWTDTIYPESFTLPQQHRRSDHRPRA